jgi:hypothetical protein
MTAQENCLILHFYKKGKTKQFSVKKRFLQKKSPPFLHNGLYLTHENVY